MPPQPLPPADRARLLQVAVGTGVAFGILEHVAGAQVAEHLQRTPFTFTGWVVTGWLVGGPTFLASALLWIGGGRLSRPRRVRGSVALGVAIGLGMFLLPASLPGSAFGANPIVGEPATQGWLWGVTATFTMAAYGTAVARILGRAAPGRVTAGQRRLTARYVEATWVVVLIVTLSAALSSETGGVLKEHLSTAIGAPSEIQPAV